MNFDEMCVKNFLLIQNWSFQGDTPLDIAIKMSNGELVKKLRDMQAAAQAAKQSLLGRLAANRVCNEFYNAVCFSITEARGEIFSNLFIFYFCTFWSSSFITQKNAISA